MGTKAEATATLSIRVECERCRSVFDYEHALKTSASHSLHSGEALAEECMNELRKKLDSIPRGENLGFRKCSTCGHMQGWMHKGQLEEHESSRIGVSAIVSVLAAIGFIVANPLGLGKNTEGTVWAWLGLLVLIPVLVLTFLLVWWLFNIFRPRAQNSTAAASSQSGPSEVQVLQGPSVVAWREEVY